MTTPMQGSQSKPSRAYDGSFRPGDTYLQALPDMQNAHADHISGARVVINQVGISNFKLPLKFKTRAGQVVSLETSITGTVSLDKDNKGINMSRILRVFYQFKDDVFTWGEIEKILNTYLDRLESEEARLKLFFNYPITQTSLRSNLQGLPVLSGDVGRGAESRWATASLPPVGFCIFIHLPLFGNVVGTRPGSQERLFDTPFST